MKPTNFWGDTEPGYEWIQLMDILVAYQVMIPFLEVPDNESYWNIKDSNQAEDYLILKAIQATCIPFIVAMKKKYLLPKDMRVYVAQMIKFLILDLIK